MPEDGLEETELQTLDFVRYLARGMADAAAVPMIEFTISDTFVAPVSSVLTMLPKLQLDTAERRDGYLARMRGIPGMVATAAQRHKEGTAAGRTAVARLVESAIAQLDLLVEDPTVGAILRPDSDDEAFAREVSAAGEAVRPPRPGDATATRCVSDVLPSARDDAHPGLCFLPGGDAMYEAMVRLHTSMSRSPDELHAMGREIVGQVRQELTETGARLFDTTDMAQIFDRLSNDPSLRYRNREEMLEHARRVVAAAEAEAPRWFAVVPDEPCAVQPVPEAEEAGMAAAYYLPGAIDGSRAGTYFLNTSKPDERHRYVAEDIAFHEAVPGHHFQLTIAMESKNLPPARRVLYDTACAEGWGLYSERLADEMGLYSDDLARMGLFPPTRGGPAGSWSTRGCTPWAGHASRRSTGWSSTRRCPGWRSIRRSTATSPTRVRPSPTWSAGGSWSACAPWPRMLLVRNSTSGSSTTWSCGRGSSRSPRWRGPSSVGCAAPLRSRDHPEVRPASLATAPS